MHKLLCLGLLLAIIPAKADHLPADLEAKAQAVFEQIKRKLPSLTPYHLRELAEELEHIEDVLSDVPDVKPFKFRLNGNTLTVSTADDKHIVNWSNHEYMKVYGNLLVLIDTNKEFAAYLSDGTPIVKKWTDTVSYWVRGDYIGLLDKKQVFDAYSLQKPETRVIANWRDTKTVLAGYRYIALLDTKGVFQGYSSTGQEVLRVNDVAEIQDLGGGLIKYTLRNGQVKTFPLVQ